MIYLTVRNKAGNHGHQLYDLIGGLTIAKIFNFKYVHTPYPYLEFAGVGFEEPTISSLPKMMEIAFHGFTKHGEGLSLEEAKSIFGPIAERKEDALIILTGLKYRIPPCRTIRWFKDGLLERDIFSEIYSELSTKYAKKHRLGEREGPIRISAHIDRGKGPKDSWKSRYVFELSYFDNIFDQVRKALIDLNYKITVYAEKGYSPGVPEYYEAVPDVFVSLGPNRREGDLPKCEAIFQSFVDCDILITCGSSFGVVASHFRRGKPTIYHPHCLLFDLPETDFCATKLDGSFDWEGLRHCLIEKLEEVVE